MPLSLVATFGVMYLAGYTIDNLSLMALTISTGFVVDDAIVVIENITRYLEKGMSPVEAALEGSREIGFTVLSMSTSLVAVFIPILLMGGIVGRMFREFAATLSVAVTISMVVSLTTTPAMCAALLRQDSGGKHNWLYRLSERSFDFVYRAYARTLRWVLRHQIFILGVTGGTVCLAMYLYVVVPKGFFPLQDTGRVFGNAVAGEDVSFQSMRQKFMHNVAIIQADPAVDVVTGFTGGRAVNTANFNITLKPLSERKVSVFEVVNRLRPKLAEVPGATLFLNPGQDVQIGGRSGNAAFQYTLPQGDSLKDLLYWAPLLESKLKDLPDLRDVNTDLQNLAADWKPAWSSTAIPPAVWASRPPRLTMSSTTPSASARSPSCMKASTNTTWSWRLIRSSSRTPRGSITSMCLPTTGQPVPLSAFTHYAESTTWLAVAHQGIFTAVTITFNIDPHVPLGDAVAQIQNVERAIGMPSSIVAGFQGTAQAFQSSLDTERILILAAVATVYIVLGILYENYVHPLTILSTLPSAGVGALLALLVTHSQLDIIALIGIILLIGIVKKNAILMIDFAIQAERNEGNSPEQSIYRGLHAALPAHHHDHHGRAHLAACPSL